MSQVKVLTVVDYYLPGYKGGGPAVSVSRLVNSLKDEFGFLIFTRDRDLGESKPYADISPSTWDEREGTYLFYAKPRHLSIFGLWSAIRESRPDVIYLNSYFSRLSRAVLVLRLLRLIRNTPILIAPRGEFSPGALKFKALKKKLYLKVVMLLGLHGGVTWQVSSVRELCDTCLITGAHGDFIIKAPDIVNLDSVELTPNRAPKTVGSARFAFISRISPKKNLLGAIEMFGDVKGDVTFTIYGPIEDRGYWSKCEAAIAALPTNIQCVYGGGVPASEVLSTLSRHHFFLFPTLGENFGHVIPEALIAGCPVLLSDQTPWLDFDKQGVGWIINLADHDGWRDTIQKGVDMGIEEFEAMASGAQEYVRELVRSSADVDENRKLFDVTIQNHDRKVA